MHLIKQGFTQLDSGPLVASGCFRSQPILRRQGCRPGHVPWTMCRGASGRHGEPPGAGAPPRPQGSHTRLPRGQQPSGGRKPRRCSSQDRVPGRQSFLPSMPWGLYHQNWGDQQVGWAGQGDSAVRRALLGVRGGDPRGRSFPSALPHSGICKPSLGRSCSHHTWHRCLHYFPGAAHRIGSA